MLLLIFGVLPVLLLIRFADMPNRARQLIIGGGGLIVLIMAIIGLCSHTIPGGIVRLRQVRREFEPFLFWTSLVFSMAFGLPAIIVSIIWALNGD